MRSGAAPRPALFGALRCTLLGVLGAATLAACGADPPPDPRPTPTPTPTAAAGARGRLAARAAAAQDRRLTAAYLWSAPGRSDRAVALTVAEDGSWRIDIQRGAEGGTADISVVQNQSGLYQCALPSQLRPEASCVRVADPDGTLPAYADPRVTHPFTNWLDVLTDRQAPLSVSATGPLPGARGSCFTVDVISASLSAPLDVGIYCFADDGTLTAARLQSGTLLLQGTPGDAPGTVALPGPVRAGKPLGMAAPPSPTVPATASSSPSATR